MLSRLVITFLPRSKRLLISWLQSPSAVILEPQKIKSATVSPVSPSICYEVMGLDAMILVFWMLSFGPTFSLSSFTFIKRLFSPSSLSATSHIHVVRDVARGPRASQNSTHFLVPVLQTCSSQCSLFIILVFWNTYSVPLESGKCPTPGPFYRWRNWGTVSLNDKSKITHPAELALKFSSMFKNKIDP